MNLKSNITAAVLTVTLTVPAGNLSRAAELADTSKTVVVRDTLEEVFADPTYQLTGVAATAGGRVFVNYPYWLDQHKYSVVEVQKDGSSKPYPNTQWNSFKKGDDGQNKFVCVQAVVTDDKNALWIVDAAGIGLSDVYQNSNKVIKVNLTTNQVERIYRFPASVAGAKSYINDIRVDNNSGFAYMTSSSNGGIVVLNLKTGASRLVLNGNPSTLSDTAYTFSIAGNTLPKGDGTNAKINSDGIALSPDKKWLYYKPLTDNRLYRVPTSLLRDFKILAKELGSGVEDLGRFTTTDGMEFDADGNLYLGDLEHSRIVKLTPDKKMITLVEDSTRLIWPDSYSITPNGYIYISCSQIQYMPWFNAGQNKTKYPYKVYRLKIK